MSDWGLVGSIHLVDVGLKTVFSLDPIDDCFDCGALFDLCSAFGSSLWNLSVWVAEQSDVKSNQDKVGSCNLVACTVFSSSICREPLFQLVKQGVEVFERLRGLFFCGRTLAKEFLEERS